MFAAAFHFIERIYDLKNICLSLLTCYRIERLQISAAQVRVSRLFLLTCAWVGSRLASITLMAAWTTLLRTIIQLVSELAYLIPSPYTNKRDKSLTTTFGFQLVLPYILFGYCRKADCVEDPVRIDVQLEICSVAKMSARASVECRTVHVLRDRRGSRSC